MRVLVAALLLTVTLPLCADGIDEVRQAETGFAKAFADRDKAKFFSYVAEDAVFVSALGTQRGKAEIVKGWSRFFDGVAVAPFSWGPERVELTSGGTVGFSMGPIFTPDGKHGGYYSSIWQKQPDGTWKIVVDGPGNPPPALKESVVPSEEGFIDAEGGAKLYYRKVGAGPVTIIAPLDYIFHDELQQFADIATVVTYDPRNRGRSNRVDVQSMSASQDVRDLEAVRAQLKIGKFMPIGYSYLGKVVLMYAAAHPDHVRRVVQLGPAGNVPDTAPPQSSNQELGVPETDLAKLTALSAATPKASAQELCEAQWNVSRYRYVGNPAHASRLVSPCAFENERMESFGAAFAVLWPTVQQPMSDEDVKKITMPVLTIHGTKDRNSPYRSGREWAQVLPDARLFTIEGGAHASWADDPVAVYGAIRHFLRGEWPLGSVKVR
jgi:proline iminopeptidase